ncbi:hypothetical protein FVE85_7671 [Porphyridium purpureum]|uniref:Pentatricopeptide repeat-containing protein n=1 Tax=Porphyridium purpureum TaxID=35688 RepID=A0A5J4Z8H7_PORPP|nr:hypothetical protein FVE85_7671 [Porphyridium purpureum]|eukprot:POR7288..scf295_1
MRARIAQLCATVRRARLHRCARETCTALSLHDQVRPDWPARFQRHRVIGTRACIQRGLVKQPARLHSPVLRGLFVSAYHQSQSADGVDETTLPVSNSEAVLEKPTESASGHERTDNPETQALNTRLQLVFEAQESLKIFRAILDEAKGVPFDNSSLLYILRILRRVPLQMSHTKLKLAVSLLQKAIRDGVLVDEFKLAHLMPLARARRKANVVAAVKNIIQKHGQRIRPLTYKGLISHYAACGRVDLMEKAFHESLRVHGFTDAETFVRALTGFLVNDAGDRAMQMWKKMRAPSFPRRILLDPSVLKCGERICNVTNDIEEATWVAAQIEKHGLQSTVVGILEERNRPSWAAADAAHASDRAHIPPETMELNGRLKRALYSRQSLARVQGMLDEAADVSFNLMSLIFLLRMAPQWTQNTARQRLAFAVRVLQRARKQGVYLHPLQFTYLLNLATPCRKVNVIVAVKRLSQAREHRVDSFAYQAMIEHFSACKRPDLMESTFEELIYVHGTPDGATFHKVLSGYLANEKPTAALKVFRRLRTTPFSRKVRVDPELLKCAALICANGCDGVEGPTWIANKFRKLQVAPIGRTLVDLGMAFAHAGEWGEALSHMRWVLRLDKPPSIEQVVSIYISESEARYKPLEALKLTQIFVWADQLVGTKKGEWPTLKRRFAQLLRKFVTDRRLDKWAAETAACHVENLGNSMEHPKYWGLGDTESYFGELLPRVRDTDDDEDSDDYREYPSIFPVEPRRRE